MANIADLQVSLNLDTSKFKSDVQAATKDVKELKTVLTGLKSRTFKIDLSTNIKSQLAGFKSAKTEIKNLQKHLTDLQTHLKANTGKKTLDLTVKTNVDTVKTTIKEANTSANDLNSTFGVGIKAVNSYGSKLKNVSDALKNVSKSAKTLTTDINTLNKSLSKTNSDLKQIGNKTITVKTNTNVNKVAKDLSGEVYKMTGTFANLEGTVKRTFTGVGSTMEEAQNNMKSLASSAGDLQQVGSRLQKSFKDANGKIVKTMTEADKAIQKTAKSSKLLENALANVKSVAQGIIIAQTFYNAVNAVQGVANSMWEMHKSVETNTMAFESLTGSMEMSVEMIEYLQQYAAKSTFTFEQVSQSAKTLLGYGIDLKNISYVMQTIGDATSAMGNTENFDRIALAIGQTLSKGTAKSEEMLQLMEANIPVVEILSEKLGMTAQEVANIGDHSVSSVKVVNALLEGLNERYGGMSENMATTTTGLINNIKESVAYVGSQLFKPLYDSFSGMLKPISDKLSELSNVIRNAGIDGALKYLFPPDMYTSIKLFCALIGELGKSIFSLISAIQPLSSQLTYTFINLFNAASPILIVFLNTLSKLISIVSANTVVMRIFATSLTALAIVTTITKAIRNFRNEIGILYTVVTFAKKGVMLLNGALAFLAANPVVLGIAAVCAALIALVMSTEKGRQAVDKLWVSLARLMGIKSVDVYEPLDPKDLEDDLDNFFGKLDSNIEGVGGGLEDVGDEAGEAGKKVKDKFVASFDELFQVPEQLDDVSDSLGNVGGGNLGDLGVGGLDDLTKNPIDTDAFDIGPIEIDTIIVPPKPPTLPTFEPILVPILVTGLEGALSALRSLANALGQIPSKIVSTIDVVATGVPTLVSSIIEQLRSIPTSISTVVELLLPNFIPNINVVTSAISGILIPTLQSIPNLFNGTIFPAFDEFVQKLKLPLPGFDLLSQSITSQLLPGFNVVYSTIKDLMLPGFAMIPQAFNSTVFPAFDDFVQKMRNTIITSMQKTPSLVSSSMGILVQTIGVSVSTIGKLISSIPGVVSDGVSPIQQILSGNFSGAFESVKNSCSAFMDWMDGKWGWLAGALALAIAGIGITLTGGWGVIIGGITTAISTFVGWIPTAFSGLISSVPAVFTKLATGVMAIFGGLNLGLVTSFADTKKDVEREANSMDNSLKSKFESMKNNLVNKVESMRSAITSSWEKVKSNTRTAWNNVKSFIETPLNAVKTTVTNIMNWFSQKFEWLTNKINTMKNTASNFLSSLNPFGRSIEGPQIALTGDMSGVTMSNPLSPLTSMSNLYNGGLMTRDNLVGNTRSRTINVIEELGTITRNTNDTKSTSSNGGFINNPNMSNSVDDRPILYVGTLIADDRSLKELERKMEVIRTKEKNRRG